jgi:hypothetical protein
LVLFVGSGVNGTLLPQWGTLLGVLVRQAIKEGSLDDHRVTSAMAACLQKWAAEHFDVGAQASIAKRILGSARYRNEVQDALYACVADDIERQIEDYGRKAHGSDRPIDPQLELLCRVADLCLLPQVKAVATFNFDVLLEYAITAAARAKGERRRPRAYFGQALTFPGSDVPASDVLPVFHVHGLLSPPSELLRTANSGLVLSHDEYFEKNADPLSWETSTSIHLLRHFCTLWLGASLKDWNMLRLLDAARRGGTRVRSYCIQCLAEAGTSATLGGEDLSTFQKVAMRLQAALFDAVGVSLIIGGEHFTDIPVTISEMVTARLARPKSGSFQ